MDPPTRSAISQKDYLKKYFSKNKTDKIKKKKLKLSSSSHLKRSQIIDDDLNLNSIADIDDENFNLSFLGDEAPQIAGIVDERPDHLKALEVYGDKKKWKPVGEEPGGSMNAYSSNPYHDNKIKEYNQNKSENLISKSDKNIIGIMIKKEMDDSEKSGDYCKHDKDRNSPPSRKLESNKWGKHREPFSPEKKSNDYESTQSPPRKRPGKDNRRLRNDSDNDRSPPRRNPSKDKRQRKCSDNDNSPPRRNLGKDNRRPRNDSDSDQAPPRRHPGKDNRRPRNDSDSDQAPSRRHPGKDNRRPRNNSDSDNSPPRRHPGKDNRKPRNGSDCDNSSPRRHPGKDNTRPRNDSDSDQAPPRRYSGKDNRRPRNNSDSDNSPPKRHPGKDNRKPRNGSDCDNSPPRRHPGKDNTRPRNDSDSDQAPPRRYSGKDNRRPRNNSDSDNSPPRRHPVKDNTRPRNDSDSDQAPPRRYPGKDNRRPRNNSDSDQSLPRRNSVKDDMRWRTDQSPARRNYFIDDRRQRKDADRDLSPPRRVPGKDDRQQRKGSDSDQSPPRRNTVKNEKYQRRGFNSNQSPPRKTNKYKGNSDSDQSPPRKPISKNNRWEEGGSNRNYSPPRKNFSNRCNDFERNEKYRERNRNILPGRKDLGMKGPNDYHSKNNASNETKPEFSDLKKNDFSKMEKTLDGKKAGLQNAKNLREELATLKEEEERMFKNMDSSRLGVGNEAVVRDRRTGRIKDLVKEKEESREKMQERLAREAKYSRWGKGLKQIEDASSKVADAVHEMSKPLARHKDDSDLDAYLKAQEREGDPMLDYIRQRQQESHTVEKLKPQYEGSYGPNRFNIRPGHRWDGVDRSNGYEAKWFASINAKKAIQEEAYKWSSADM